ncbi:hypothetical protein LCGC14_0747360 [marine sediment metagenome]|uniref:Uncharacterized protein n=1 Tax=marine sediment metagenome TaxID=412755 RepID=A0A0F9SPZ9_9ZZZZ
MSPPVAGDVTLTLDQDFLLNSGSTIARAAKKGPVPTFTRASDAGSFISTGVFALVGANDLPRFAHDPADSNAQLGLLIEEVRTNVCLQSDDLETTWVNPGSSTTITADAGTAATGNVTADDVKHTISTNSLQQLITATDNTVYTISAVVQQGDTGSHDWVKMAWLDHSDGDNGFEAWFDLSTGNVGTAQATGTGSYTASSVFMTDIGGGRYRIGATGQIVSGQTDARFEIINTTADAVDTAETTNSVYWSSLQAEIGTFASSIIPTTTASVTRAAETCSTTDVSWAADGVGTFVAEAVAVGQDSATLFSLNDGSTSDDINSYWLTTNGNMATRKTAGTDGDAQATAVNWAVGVSQKIAFAYATNDIALSVGGAAVITDSSADPPAKADITTFKIGGAATATLWWNETIKSIKYYNVRKADTFLVAETT